MRILFFVHPSMMLVPGLQVEWANQGSGEGSAAHGQFNRPSAIRFLPNVESATVLAAGPPVPSLDGVGLRTEESSRFNGQRSRRRGTQPRTQTRMWCDLESAVVGFRQVLH